MLSSIVQYQSATIVPNAVTHAVKLTVCQTCWSVVLPEHQQKHRQWHGQIDPLTRRPQ